MLTTDVEAPCIFSILHSPAPFFLFFLMALMWIIVFMCYIAHARTHSPLLRIFLITKSNIKKRHRGWKASSGAWKTTPPPTCHHGLWNMHENGHISTCTQRNALSLHFFIKLWGETGFGRGALKDTWRGQLWPPDMWKCQKKVAKTETPLDRNLAYNTELGTSIAP